MTEEEWLTCGDLEAMLRFVRDRASARKLRLFAVACCRRLEIWLPDQRSWDAVHVAEWCADGHGGGQDLEAARRDAEASYRLDRAGYAAVAATAADAWQAATGVLEAVYHLAWEWYEEGAEADAQAALLRDLFGPLPFRPVPVDPAWLAYSDGAVRRVAQAIYDGRRFDELPILADALEEAGCTSAELLGHCRSGGEHARGCWVLDALLGMG
jgi:hypothetical protein